MTWHQEPKKDVTSCEKLRLGANIHRPADIRMGKPGMAIPYHHGKYSHVEETSELKHLSRRRKKETSISKSRAASEREKEAKPEIAISLGLRTAKLIQYFFSRSVWGRHTIVGNSPVSERILTRGRIRSTTGHEEPGEAPGTTPKPKYYLMTDSEKVRVMES